MGDAYPRIGGCARRLIDLRQEDANTAVGWLEDDFHHVGITIEHANNLITALRVQQVRLPFSTCPAAQLALAGLQGQELRARSTDIGLMVPMRQQCTHMFDLAGLVMAHAASGRTHRRYEATTSDRQIVAWEEGHRRVHGPGTAELSMDGRQVLAWQIDRREITGPHDWAGQSLTTGFRERTQTMTLDEAEQAAVLRRAVMIASGRTLDPDLYPSARDRGQSGVCYTFLEENRDQGMRVLGNTMNYEASSHGMLSRLTEVP